MATMAVIGATGAVAYTMMDRKKQAKVEKILNNAADEAHKMLKKMDN